MTESVNKNKGHMADYISKQDAIKVLTQKEREKFNDWERSGDELSLYAKKIYSNSIFVIYDLPPVDAVEVVRCKNCKHFDSGTDEDGKLFFKCLGWVYGGTNEDDFCSHGERKDG